MAGSVKSSSMNTSMRNTGLTSEKGWGGQVLNLLFTIFVIAVTFGVLLIAATSSNSTLQGLQNGYDTWTTASVNSVQATNFNSFNSGNMVLSWRGASWVSAANPAKVVIVANVVTTAGTNTPQSAASSVTTNTYTFTSTSLAVNQVIANSNNVFEIQTITVTGLLPNDTNAIAVVNDLYYPYAYNQLIANFPASGNVLTGTGVVTVSAPTVGSTTSTPVAVFASLIAYLVTLANFTGIIILLAIIVIVIGILYYFFGNKTGTQDAFGGSQI